MMQASTYSSILEWKDILENLLLKGESTAIGLFRTDGTLLYANEAMCYFLDTDPMALLPKNSLVNPDFQTLITTHSSELIFDGMMTIGNRGYISYDLHSKVFRRNDTLLVFGETNIPLLFSENEKMSELNQEVNNLQRQIIKEKKNLQNTLDELRETQQMLIHSEKMNAMGKLVAGVAHELNNPISFVYSNMFSLETNLGEFFGLLDEVNNLVRQNDTKNLARDISTILNNKEMDDLKEDLKDLAKESKHGIERVKTIVEDLRRFSRLDESEIKRINILDNLRSTFTIIKSEIANKSIVFTYQIPNMEVDCYPGQLNQAILNVLINAIQAVEKGGHIDLFVQEEKENLVISIQDDGCGISDDLKNRIFEPFFTTKPVGTGTGLGLSITYKIIHDLHHGQLDVESTPGKGTTMNLTIPSKQP